MKTKLQLKPHLINDQEVVELWWEGSLIGTITGADGPGIKIQSKYRRYVMWEDDLQTEIGIGELTVRMEDKKEDARQKDRIDWAFRFNATTEG